MSSNDTDQDATRDAQQTTVAHQVVVHEETYVGTEDAGETRVVDVELVPPSATRIHPDAADRVKQDFDIEFLSEYGVYVAEEADDAE